MSDVQTYDLIVIGGGMVGAALTRALHGRGLRIALVDTLPADSGPPDRGYDMRVSALTLASRNILQSLGAWSVMESMRISPFGEIEVWDASGDGRVHFDCAEIGEPELGYIVENSVTRAALFQAMAGQEGVEFIQPARLQSLRWDNHWAYVGLDNGQQLAAPLVVGADGAQSRVREQAGIAVKGWSYQQTAVVTTVKPEHYRARTALQRFMPDGPLAFLPLGNGYYSIVWSTSPEHAEQLLALDDEQFAVELAKTSQQTLGGFSEIAKRGAFPLRLRHADAYIRPRIALVGDAAHTIHPLAGQGVNLGLADAATLAQIILEGLEARQDIGSLAVLRRYERWRKGETLAMMAAMEGFKRLFGSEVAPVRWLRNLGLNLTQTLIPVKNVIMRQAMGLRGDLPELARRRA